MQENYKNEGGSIPNEMSLYLMDKIEKAKIKLTFENEAKMRPKSKKKN